MLRSPGIFVVVEPISASGVPSTGPHRSTNMEEHPRNGDSDEQKNGQAVKEQESQGQATKRTISRRQFLIISAIAGGVAGTGLLIGFNVIGRQGHAGTRSSTSPAPTTSFAPNVWVRIDADNTVTIWVARSEMGQGVLTTLALLIAEELDADWVNVRVEQALADTRYGDQKTDGSSSVSDSFVPLRFVGAGARTLLVTAAAQT